MKLTIKVLKDIYCISRLEPNQEIPKWIYSKRWYSITKTADELSIVCEQGDKPDNLTTERDWRCLKIEGILDFSLVGILSKISTLMADNGISIFAISTFDTDYVLVKIEKAEEAICVLASNGYSIIRE